MKLRIVPARQGLVWLRRGLEVARLQPFHLMGLLGLVVSAGILLAGVPLLGPMVVVAAMPLVWAGFMLATRRTLTQQRITPAVLIEALRGPNHHRQGFAQLGLAYLLATLAVMQLAHVLGPGADVLGQVIEQSKSASEVMTRSATATASSMVWMLVVWRCVKKF